MCVRSVGIVGGRERRIKMTDISKCDGQKNKCPLRKKCYRFTSPVGVWQSWIAGEYKKGKCENYQKTIGGLK